MSGATEKDALAVVDTAVQRARVSIYDILGTTRVAAVLSTEFTETPSTDDELDRSKAALAELLWIKGLLVVDLPTLFIDSSGIVNRAWNESAMERDQSFVEVKEVSDRLLNEAKAMLQDLATGEASAIRATAFGPTETPPRPGESVLFEF
jgi:hypothetical protein